MVDNDFVSGDLFTVLVKILAGQELNYPVGG